MRDECELNTKYTMWRKGLHTHDITIIIFLFVLICISNILFFIIFTVRKMFPTYKDFCITLYKGFNVSRHPPWFMQQQWNKETREVGIQCTKLIYKGVVRLPSVFHGSSRDSSSLLLLYVHNALSLNSMASVIFSVSLLLTRTPRILRLCLFLPSYSYIINAILSPFATSYRQSSEKSSIIKLLPLVVRHM